MSLYWAARVCHRLPRTGDAGGKRAIRWAGGGRDRETRTRTYSARGYRCHCTGLHAFASGCPELVTLVENGQFDGPEVEEIVRRALEPILREDIDVIVLGCTHF